MEFKFQADYNNLKEQCPPEDYLPKQIENVFRFVFEDIDNQKNFQSQYHKNPKRFQEKSDAEKCEALALSMFDNLTKAKEFFSKLKARTGNNIYQTIGNSLAVGSITEKAGVNGKVDRKGHFNHLHQKQTIITYLKFLTAKKYSGWKILKI